MPRFAGRVHGRYWILAGALCVVGALGVRMLRADPARLVERPAVSPLSVAPLSATRDAAAGPLVEVERPAPADGPAPSGTDRDARKFEALSRQFPGGLEVEAGLALRAGDAKRALQVALELSRCEYFQSLRRDFEQRGLQSQLEKMLPGTDPEERAHVHAFCQTGGVDAQALTVQLARLAASQGMPEAVYWVYEEQWDPSGAAARQVGQWALNGQDLLAVSKALLAANPALLGLSPDDVNVVRKASARVLEQPEFASRLGFKGGCKPRRPPPPIVWLVSVDPRPTRSCRRPSRPLSALQNSACRPQMKSRYRCW